VSCTITVTSTATPRITWHCPTCRRPQPFACSERFRANANGKVVDIWLIYRCERCDATKNITVVERTPVRRVDRRLLEASMDNDAPTARRVSRDVGLLRRAGATIATGDAWRVDGGPLDAPGPFTLAFPEALLVRLDAVVAAAVAVPRKQVAAHLVDAPGRLDSLRLWSTVELALERRQSFVGRDAIGVPVDAREHHQLLGTGPSGQLVETGADLGRAADDR
jgi:hypothetical protein